MAKLRTLQFYRGTAAQWTSADPVLGAGEPGFESDTYKIKIGDGTTAWTSLAYFASDSVLNKYDATVAPTANEDSGDGYSVGSVWIDVTADTPYILVDATVAAAVWVDISGGGGGGTVTSVAQTVPTGLTVSGSPVTTTGTLAIAYDTGYQGFTTAEASAISANTAKTGVTTEISNVVEDTTPQLGGELDQNGFSVGGTPQSATGDGTTTINWGLGNTFNFTFGAFNETFTFTAPAKPGVFLLKLVQDSGGSRTATWPATVKWPTGAAPTLTITATTGTDIITFYYDGTNYFGVSSLNFS